MAGAAAGLVRRDERSDVVVERRVTAALVAEEDLPLRDGQVDRRSEDPLGAVLGRSRAAVREARGRLHGTA
jgi:hypothetical protein